MSRLALLTVVAIVVADESLVEQFARPSAEEEVSVSRSATRKILM